jgi:zinc/manganese transport system substrate-binding protein
VPHRWKALAAATALAGAALLAAGCSSSSAADQPGPDGKIIAVGAENEYADVIAQVGGKYVQASAIMSNPNTDPHTFEKAVPDSGRRVIVVQKLLGLPDSTPNPHLWYDPATMPKVAGAIADNLAAIQPSHAAYFKANAKTFANSLAPWIDAIGTFKQHYPGTPVATTEPVADYLLQALGADNKTPWAFQADVMNGTDPSAQDVAAERSLFTQHKVKAFLYNQQVTDTLTESFVTLAHANGIPVVGVYETMPEPGYHYQSWMLAEVRALQKAVTSGVSSEHL